jgi:hypothetical protein
LVISQEVQVVLAAAVVSVDLAEEALEAAELAEVGKRECLIV